MMLFTGVVRPRSTVLIHSAAGGVGLAAIELARAHECVLIGTASPSKHDFLRERGMQHPIDYADYVSAVRKIVGDRGVDLVLDPIGGRAWKDNYALLGPGGRLVCFGASSNAVGKRRSLLAVLRFILNIKLFNPLSLMNDNKTVSGVNMGHLFDRIDLLQPQFESLVAMYERGEIKPYVDRSFRFDDAPAAHHYLHDRKARGKVLLVP
jgi:NADPH:quinone reductase-like Zn-dependent oxidoreductase